MCFLSIQSNTEWLNREARYTTEWVDFLWRPDLLPMVLPEPSVSLQAGHPEKDGGYLGPHNLCIWNHFENGRLQKGERNSYLNMSADYYY